MGIKVSVILPVYNCEKYLEAAISSVINQSIFNSSELILVDDGSTDGSAKICDKFAEKFENIIAFHQKNSGVSVARNTGIDIAKGEYITFLDSDDKYMPGYLEELLSHSDCDLVCCDYFSDTGNNLILKKFFNKNLYVFSDFNAEFYAGIITPEFYSCWNKLYKYSIIEKYTIRFKPGVKYAEDMIFIFEYLKLCESFYYIDKPLYFYNINPENTTSVIKNGFEVQRFIFNEQKKLFEQMDNYDIILKKIEENFVYCTTQSINSEITYNSFSDSYKYLKRVLSSEFFELYIKENYTEFKCTYDKVFFNLLKKKSVFLTVLWRKIFDLRSRILHG